MKDGLSEGVEQPLTWRNGCGDHGRNAFQTELQKSGVSDFPLGEKKVLALRTIFDQILPLDFQYTLENLFGTVSCGVKPSDDAAHTAADDVGNRNAIFLQSFQDANVGDSPGPAPAQSEANPRFKKSVFGQEETVCVTFVLRKHQNPLRGRVYLSYREQKGKCGCKKVRERSPKHGTSSLFIQN
jgi:hypothetical protein